MVQQMKPHLQSIYSNFLSAYRSRSGCHSVLIHAIEFGKNALDNKMNVGVLITDISKASDCLPHNLMIKKFRKYRLSERASALYK